MLNCAPTKLHTKFLFTLLEDYVENMGYFRCIAKLRSLDTLPKAIASSYAEGIVTIRYDNLSTEKLPYDYGIAQGDALSPLLFAIFVSSISLSLNDTEFSCEMAELMMILRWFSTVFVLGNKLDIIAERAMRNKPDIHHR